MARLYPSQRCISHDLVRHGALNKSRGMTLVELVIVVVVVGVAAASSLSALSLLGGHSSDAMIQTRMIDLAQLYADEILAQRFDEASGNGGAPPYVGCRITNDGEARDEYDDVDDYDAITSESPAFIDQSLAALYSGYLISVDVSCDNTVGANTGGVKRVDITITAPASQQSIFTVYRGNF